MKQPIRFSAKLVITNRAEKPRICWVEPWGEDYTLLPGEKTEIIARDFTTPPWFQVTENDDSSQSVWIENSNDYDVLQDGVKLSCGHQRHAAIDAGCKL